VNLPTDVDKAWLPWRHVLAYVTARPECI